MSPASSYNGRRVFRAGRAMLLMTVGAAVLFAVVAAGLYFTKGWTWMTIGMVAATALVGVGGIIEALVLRIELTDTAMIVTDLRGRRSYDIDSIEKIEELKGVPPAIRLKDGSWAKLPSVEFALGNSVRAWLKAHHGR